MDEFLIKYANLKIHLETPSNIKDNIKNRLNEKFINEYYSDSSDIFRNIKPGKGQGKGFQEYYGHLVKEVEGVGEIINKLDPKCVKLSDEMKAKKMKIISEFLRGNFKFFKTNPMEYPSIKGLKINLFKEEILGTIELINHEMEIEIKNHIYLVSDKVASINDKFLNGNLLKVCRILEVIVKDNNFK